MRLFTSISLLFFATFLFGQEVDCTRSASLTGANGYTNTGTCTLERFDDGRVVLNMSQDFAVSRGPDLRIYLSNSARSTNDGIELFLISDILGSNVFSGALSFELPADINIEDFTHVVTYCKAFRQLWGSGELSTFDCAASDGSNAEEEEEEEEAEEVECFDSATATTAWVAEITVCTDDGVPDPTELRTTLSEVTLGQDYSFLLTDANQNLQQVINEFEFDFDDTGLETQLVFGITGQRAITVCTDDGIADNIGLRTSLTGITLGQDYSFLVTDNNNILQAVVNSTSFNFDNTGLETQRVFGIHYQGALNAVVGRNITEITAADCVQLSSNTAFLTINKESCVETFECVSSTVSSTAGGQTTICPTDGVSDVISFTNSLGEAPVDNYAYIISDDRDIITQVLTADSFDFEGSGDGTLRVRGVHFDGTFQASIGSSVTSVTATGCAQVSSGFITINKGNCPTTGTTRSVSGVITNPDGAPLRNVTVNAGNRSAITDAQGRFTIEELQTDVSLSISPVNNENAANGISSLDIILVTRHILGTQSFTDPYQLLAADVNNSGSISAADLVGIQRVLLNLTSEFDGQPSWIYVPADADLSASAIRSGVQTSLTIAASEQDIQGLNFIGVKIGDLNDSASIE